MKDKFAKLRALQPPKETQQTKRYVISVAKPTYDRLAELCDELEVSRSDAITLLMNFYEQRADQ